MNVSKFNDQHFIVEPIYKDHNLMKLNVSLRTNILNDIITKWTYIINTSDDFIRIIENKTYHYKDGVILFYEEKLTNLDYITPLNPNKKALSQFITLDI